MALAEAFQLSRIFVEGLVEPLVGNGVCGLAGIAHSVDVGVGVGVDGGTLAVVNLQIGPLVLQVELLKATTCQ